MTLSSVRVRPAPPKSSVNYGAVLEALISLNLQRILFEEKTLLTLGGWKPFSVKIVN
jgi:hypothetical protein